MDDEDDEEDGDAAEDGRKGKEFQGSTSVKFAADVKDSSGKGTRKVAESTPHWSKAGPWTQNESDEEEDKDGGRRVNFGAGEKGDEGGLRRAEATPHWSKSKQGAWSDDADEEG